MLSSRLTPEQLQQWADRIEEWRTSGKSIVEWCRENEVSYHKFLYWRNLFSQDKKKCKNPMAPTFIELPKGETSDTGVTLEHQGFCIRLSKGFDHSILRSLILFLRRL